MTLNLPPQKVYPSEDWEYIELWKTINKLIRLLPTYFESEIVVKGIDATDLYSIGSVFSAAIESSLVDILNRTRNLWDADNNYLTLSFKRQSQTFPDAVLVNSLEDDRVIFGIELKAWYALSKEGEPSFRFKIDPDACAEADLLVVYPWLLSDVTAGKPILLSPYVELAKYAAEMRNYKWQEYRQSKGESAEIIRPEEKDRKPYPPPKKNASDSAVNDKGNNFGRIARSGQGGFLDSYSVEILNIYYLGLKLKHWIKIFKAVADGHKDKETDRLLDNALAQIQLEFLPEPDIRFAPYPPRRRSRKQSSTDDDNSQGS